MRHSTLRFGVVAALFLAGAIHGCSSAERNRSTGNTGGEEETGGSGGSATGGSKASGGSGGKATGGSVGSTGGSGGATTGGAGGATGGSGGATGGSGGATGGSGGATGGSGGGGAGGTDGGAGGAPGKVAVCWPDPKVIKICHQLENACENCGPLKGVAPPRNTKAKPCFDLVALAYKGMATDADCAQHAIDNDCTVDGASTTGNVCGSLDCNPMTCGGTSGGRTCESAKQWGDSSICNYFYQRCPCK